MKAKILIILFIVLALGIWGYTIYSNHALEKAISMPNSAEKTVATFEIKPGESMSAVAANLKKAGLMGNTDPFIKYAKNNELDKKVKAGVYTLNTAMSPREILEVFVSGSRSEIWITIPEGWRIDQIAEYLGKQGLLFTVKEFEDYAYVKNFSSTPVLSGLSGKTTLEGYLFPDTYKVYSDAEPTDVIQSMLDNFSQKVTKDMMDKANKMGFNLHQFITLTSIIEKESAHNEDIRIIASVYHNRLKDGMLFQSDATITYITRRPDASPTFDETKIDDPYNTYLYKGLPPGPVGNPGVAAMEATLNPETTDWLFFLTDSENRAHFAKTYEEHLANQEKYMN
jgi:UPF0755 protein